MSLFFCYLCLLIRFSFLVKGNMAPFTMCWKKTLTKLSWWLETCLYVTDT
jgi:hypothetical protein